MGCRTCGGGGTTRRLRAATAAGATLSLVVYEVTLPDGTKKDHYDRGEAVAFALANDGELRDVRRPYRDV